jgi:hypothetical protein
MPRLLHSSKDQIELKRLMGWSKKSLEKKRRFFVRFFSRQNVDGLVLVEQSYIESSTVTRMLVG